MRKSLAIAVLAVLAAIGWCLAWTSWASLSEAKGRLANAQVSASAAARERDELNARLHAMAAELASAQSPAKIAADHKPAPPPAPTQPRWLEARPDYFQRVVEDPEVNALFVAQQKRQLRGKYEFLLKLLHLTPAEEEAFLKRLVEKRVTAMDVANVAKANGLKPNDDAILTGLDQANADSDQAIRALLGDDRFARYQSFDKNIVLWNSLYGLSRDIAAGSSPLDGPQCEVLMKIFAQPSGPDWPGDNAAPAEMDAYVANYAEWIHGALKQAGTALTPEQVAALGNYFEGTLLAIKMKAAFQHPGPGGP